MESLSFAELLRKALRDHGLSQTGLSKKIKRDKSTISSWVAGRTRPRPSEAATLEALAALMGLSPRELKTRLEGESPTAKPEETPATDLFTVADFEDAFDKSLAQFFAKFHHVDTSGAAERLQADALRLGLAIGDPDAFKAWLDEKIQLWNRSLASNDAFAPSSPGAGEAGGEDARDRIRLTCLALNAEFARNDYVLSKQRYAGILAMHGLALTGPAATRLLQEKLISEESGLVRAHWQIAAEFIVNRVLGFSSGIGGLDEILDGALVPAHEGGPTILLRGRYGAGKSTVALEIGAALADQGCLVFYLSSEEEVDSLANRLSFIGYHTVRAGRDCDWVRYVSADGSTPTRQLRVARNQFVRQTHVAAMLADSLSDGDPVSLANGLLCLVKLSGRQLIPGRLNELSRELDGVAEDHPERQMVLIIDSLDAVSPAEDRRFLERAFAFHRRPKRLPIFISSSNATLRDYLADMVIELGWRPRGEDLTERTIEISKSRLQNHRRGAHGLSIEGEEGVTVFPSAGVLSSVWSRKLSGTHRGHVWWKAAATDGGGGQILDLSELLADDFREGYSALIYGEPGTRKLPLALSFAAAGVARDEQCLFFSFVEDQQRVLNVIEGYPQLAPLVNEGNGLSNQFLFHHKTLDAFMPERILHWLRRRYKSAKGTRPTPRAVIFGLATYLSEFSTVSQGEHLIPTIQLMFRKDGVSTLFVDTHSHLKNGLDLREFFDIVMVTNRQRERGEVRLAVERSIIGKASRHSRVLHRTENGFLTLVDERTSSSPSV